MNKNFPLHVKLDVLDKCAKASLIYACETRRPNISDVERYHRPGLKTAFNVRQNSNNEIVHIESRKMPYECKSKAFS